MTGIYLTKQDAIYEIFNGEIKQGKRRVSHLMAKCLYPTKRSAFPIQAKDIERNVKFGSWKYTMSLEDAERRRSSGKFYFNDEGHQL